MADTNWTIPTPSFKYHMDKPQIDPSLPFGMGKLSQALQAVEHARQEDLAKDRILQFMLALAPTTMNPALSGPRSMEEMAEWTACAAAELDKAYCNCCEIETYKDEIQEGE